MNWLTPILLFSAAFLAVFLESYFEVVRDLLGAQVHLLPPLMVCAGLSRSVGTTALLAVCAGLWFDSLSNNPLGVSVLPLFLVGFVVGHYRDLLLRQNALAQFALGLAASLLCPLLTVFLLLNMGASPLASWDSAWQFVVMAVGGGLLTPLFCRLFEWADSTLNYQPASQSSFRPDREIKHGRGRL